ncbi:MAG: gamma-glutamylcyclotransferase family protein [Pseudomonadota bacterium]
MSDSQYFAYFGYGSLVNRDTLRTRYVSAHRARLSGWRRTWQPRPDTPFGDISLLTVKPHAETTIEGLLIIDHLENLPALDEREMRYDRVQIGQEQVDMATEVQSAMGSMPVYLYVAQPQMAETGAEGRIIQSYLDAVMQGYLVEFGQVGLDGFLSSTDEFHRPMLEDRHAPTYPRAVTLSSLEQDLFDRMLASRRGFPTN